MLAGIFPKLLTLNYPMGVELILPSCCLPGSISFVIWEQSLLLYHCKLDCLGSENGK